MEANGFKSLSSPTGPINNNEPFGLIELQELNKRSTQFLVLASTVSNYRSVVDRSADIMENDNGPLELLYRTSTTESEYISYILQNVTTTLTQNDFLNIVYWQICFCANPSTNSLIHGTILPVLTKGRTVLIN